MRRGWAVLVSAAVTRRVTPEIAALAVGSAAGLGAVDTIYAARRRIAPIYLGDAAVEAAIVAAWLASTRRGGARP